MSEQFVVGKLEIGEIETEIKSNQTKLHFIFFSYEIIGKLASRKLRTQTCGPKFANTNLRTETCGHKVYFKKSRINKYRTRSDDAYNLISLRCEVIEW